MADMDEDEAVLHLKRALGELESGDAVPPPLQPVQPKPKPQPPPNKVQKTSQAQKAPSPAVVGPQLGPPLGPQLGAQLGFSAHVGPQLGPQLPQVGPQPRQAQPQGGGGGRSGGGQQRTSAGTTTAASGPGAGIGPGANSDGQKDSQLPAAMTGMAGMPSMKNMQGKMPTKGGQATPGPPPAPLGPGGLTPGLQPGMPMPGMPGPMPGVPPGFQPVAHTPPAAPALSAAAAAAAAAAAVPGKSQSSFEIPQSKVGLVMGKQGQTLNAIKHYAKAQCFVDQHTPDDDRARVLVVGSSSEIEKCKQTVLALVDGTLSLPTLFQLAGLPMPRNVQDGSDQVENSATERAPPRPAGLPPAAPPLAPPGLGPPLHTLPPLPGLPGMPSLPNLPGMSLPANVPGMPEDRQMQQNLNDYYARMWSTYANIGPQHPHPSEQPKRQDDGPAFDKDALARLAEQAAMREMEPEPPPEPAPPPPLPTPPPVPVERAAPSLPPQPPSAPPPQMVMSAGFVERAPDRQVLTAPPGTAPGPAPPATAPAPTPPMAAPVQVQPLIGAAPPRRATLPEFTLKGFLRPTSEPQKPKKDDDSVQKMLERLQGNAQQTKQAVAMTEQQQQPGMGAREAGGLLFSAVVRENSQSRADLEFQALVSRMQQVQHPEDIEHVCREVLIRFPAFTPQQVTELLQKVDSAAGLQSDDFLAELARLLIPRLKEVTSSQFTSLTSTLASWSADARGDRRKRAGRFPELSRSFFNAASIEMSSRLMEFAPHEINCCLAAFVSVGYNEHKFFASVGRAALARHSSFAPVQLTALLAILSEMRLVHADLFNAAAAFLSMRVKELRPVDIIRVIRSYAKCSVQHQGLCKAISDEVVTRVKEKGYGATFKTEDLVEIAWALCVLQHYHEALFRVMLKSLEKVPEISTDALCQLYEWHLVLDSDFKESYARYAIGSEHVQALMDHYKDNRKDERRCSERQRNDVASVLKSLVDGSVHVNHRTSTGLLVDVAALRKRSSSDGFVHVDLDSVCTVVRSLDQDDAAQATLITEGQVALRRAILVKNGLRLITVRESEWRELDDSKDKRRFLRSLLSSAGDVLK